MKYINKGEEPTEFTEWKGRTNHRRSYKNLGNPTKSIVKQALMEEQGYICCYCEQALIETDSHIEHFIPQTRDPEKDIEFSNMLCSCQNQVRRGEPRHCGNLKADQELAISPLDENCEQYFKYTYDGYIEPVDEKARTTIETLGLNIDKLNALRKEVIEAFIDDNLTEDELIKFVSEYLKKVDGKYQPFYTTIKFLFDRDSKDTQ